MYMYNNFDITRRLIRLKCRVDKEKMEFELVAFMFASTLHWKLFVSYEVKFYSHLRQSIQS